MFLRFAQAPEGDPPAATPTITPTPAAPVVTTTPAPVATAQPDPEAERIRAEHAQLTADQATRNKAAADAKKADALKTRETAAAETKRLEAEVAAMRSTLRAQAVQDELGGAKIRDGFEVKFTEGLKFTDGNKLTDEDKAELDKRKAQFAFLLDGTPPAPVDRTQRTTPGALGAPAPVGNWSEADQKRFLDAKIKNPSKMNDVLDSSVFKQMNKGGQLKHWGKAFGGRS